MKLFDKLNSYLTNYHYYCQLNWFSMLNIFRNLFLMGYPSVTILIIKPNSYFRNIIMDIMFINNLSLFLYKICKIES